LGAGICVGIGSVGALPPLTFSSSSASSSRIVSVIFSSPSFDVPADHALAALQPQYNRHTDLFGENISPFGY
jgi:hypothetical protein